MADRLRQRWRPQQISREPRPQFPSRTEWAAVRGVDLPGGLPFRQPTAARARGHRARPLATAHWPRIPSCSDPGPATDPVNRGHAQHPRPAVPTRGPLEIPAIGKSIYSSGRCTVRGSSVNDWPVDFVDWIGVAVRMFVVRRLGVVRPARCTVEAVICGALAEPVLSGPALRTSSVASKERCLRDGARGYQLTKFLPAETLVKLHSRQKCAWVYVAVDCRFEVAE